MKFKELLKKKDLHGAQLARRLGCNRANVSAWCCGKTRPPMDYLPKIAEILGVSVEEIVLCFVQRENER